MYPFGRCERTWLSNADLHIPALKIGLGVCERLLQSVHSGEFDVSETFRLVIQFVLYYANACDLAILEKVFNIGL